MGVELGVRGAKAFLAYLNAHNNSQGQQACPVHGRICITFHREQVAEVGRELRWSGTRSWGSPARAGSVLPLRREGRAASQSPRLSGPHAVPGAWETAAAGSSF